MKKNKLLIIILLLLCLIKIDIAHAKNIYKEYKIGDKITYRDMEFYVIESSDSSSDRVTMLKAEPLTYEEIQNYSAGTGVSTYDSKGYGGMQYYSSETCGYNGSDWIYDGCTTDYAQSEVKYVVDAWATDKINRSDLIEDKLGYKTRLLTFEDLTNNLGYVWGEMQTAYIPSAENIPSWVYNSNYSYWTMSPHEDSASYVWNVYYSSEVSSDNVNNSRNVVRPVVTIKKEPIEIKKLADEEYKIGDIVEYNNMLFYVIKDSTEKDNSVTLLKAEPLSVEEVNKYGIDSNGVNHVNRHSNGSVGTAYDKNGYGEMQYYSSETCGYDDSKLSYNGGWIFDGCKNDYGSSEVKYVVDAWALDKFSNGVLTKDSTGYSARLIMLEELLKNLGYGYDESGKIQNSINGNTPTWVYSSSYYWTMSPLENLNDVIWGVDSDGSVHGSFGYVGNTQVIRPVVTLKKITEENSENTEIEKEEDSIKNEVTEDNKKPNQIVSVPDTLLKKPFIFVVLGIILIVISTTIYILIGRKDKFKKKKI